MRVMRRERYVPKRANQAWSMDFVIGSCVKRMPKRVLSHSLPDVPDLPVRRATVNFRLMSSEIVPALLARLS